MAALEYKEYVLQTNTFKQPKTLTGKEAIATLLTRLILLEPGTNPLHPTMGVGIVSRYRYLYPNAETELIDRVKDQIKKYLPTLQCTNVDIAIQDDKSIDIKITIDDTIYVYDSSTSSTPISLASVKTV